MPSRLSREEIVTIEVLAAKGQNHCEIGRTLGVSEGTVRYHLRRAESGPADGRTSILSRRATSLFDTPSSCSALTLRNVPIEITSASPPCQTVVSP